MDHYFSQTAGNHEIDQRSGIHARDDGFDATPDGLWMSSAVLQLDPTKEST